jgi:hypothetical protein
MTLADITNSAGAKLSEWVTNPRYSQLSQWWSYPQLSQPSQTKLHSMEWLHQASPASFYIWYKQQANGNLLETGTKVKFLKRATKFSPQQTTRSTHLKQNPATWYKSMNDSTPTDPVDGTINDHHQHWLFQSMLYQDKVNSRPVTSSQTTPKELRMLSIHLSSINHHGKTKCWEDIREWLPSKR